MTPVLEMSYREAGSSSRRFGRSWSATPKPGSLSGALEMPIDFTAPVEISADYSSVIDAVLDKFVQGHKDWQAIHWYHDEPIWFLRRAEGAVVRRVQLAAFHPDNRAERDILRLIPDVYRVLDGRAIQRSDAAAVRAVWQSIPLEKPDRLEADLWGKLPEACQAASSLPIPYRGVNPWR